MYKGHAKSKMALKCSVGGGKENHSKLSILDPSTAMLLFCHAAERTQAVVGRVAGRWGETVAGEQVLAGSCSKVPACTPASSSLHPSPAMPACYKQKEEGTNSVQRLGRRTHVTHGDRWGVGRNGGGEGHAIPVLATHYQHMLFCLPRLYVCIYVLS